MPLMDCENSQGENLGTFDQVTMTSHGHDFSVWNNGFYKLREALFWKSGNCGSRRYSVDARLAGRGEEMLREVRIKNGFGAGPTRLRTPNPPVSKGIPSFAAPNVGPKPMAGAPTCRGLGGVLERPQFGPISCRLCPGSTRITS